MTNIHTRNDVKTHKKLSNFSKNRLHTELLYFESFWRVWNRFRNFLGCRQRLSSDKKQGLIWSYIYGHWTVNLILAKNHKTTF